MKKRFAGTVLVVTALTFGLSGCATIQMTPKKEKMQLVNRGVYDVYRVRKVKPMSVRVSDLIPVVENGYVVRRGVFVEEKKKEERKSNGFLSEIGNSLVEFDNNKLHKDRIVDGYEITIINKKGNRTYIYALQPIRVGSSIDVYKSEAYSSIEAVIIK